ncbi:Protein CBG25887 [Caenorhabditis briggsae]|uniref:Protein CBG25887 n=1 Tax=Caenorhabditis briggsae TaxID=6238 RepID=B6IHP2_CAEBR|nr:Protein CBG25887 [Caenorhabditis briggsae]CAR99398.1 Protein CBG25887 [Caenorhabditis briggsae]
MICFENRRSELRNRLRYRNAIPEWKL